MSFVYPTGVAKKLPSGFTLVTEQSCDACGDAVLSGIRKEDPDMWDGQVFCEHCWSNVCIRAEVMKGLAGQTIIMKKTRANISKTIRSWRDDEAGIFPCVVKYVKELLPHSMDETKLQVVFQSSCHSMSEHSHKELQDMASNGEQLWEGRGRYAGKWYCRHCWHLFWDELECNVAFLECEVCMARKRKNEINSELTRCFDCYKCSRCQKNLDLHGLKFDRKMSICRNCALPKTKACPVCNEIKDRDLMFANIWHKSRCISCEFCVRCQNQKKSSLSFKENDNICIDCRNAE